MNIQDLKSIQTKNGRLVGLDLGDKTIGVSLSDFLWVIASPHLLVKRSTIEKDLKYLQEIFVKNKVVGIVIGLPINMNGTEGPQAQKARVFAEHLKQAFDIPIVLWDERLSTMAVTRTLLEADVSRKRRGGVVDKMAATFILQGVLDRLKL